MKKMKESTKKNVIRVIMLIAAIAMILSFVLMPLMTGAEENVSLSVSSFESGGLADALAKAADGTDRNNIRSVTVSGGTLSASDYAALCDMPNLEYIDLSGASTENGIVPDNALPARNQLTELKLPYNTLTIGNSAFNNCKKLKSVTIPATAESFGDYIFDGCIALEDITVPANLNHLGEAAFRDCQSLSAFTLPQGVTEIPAYCFCKCPLAEFYIGPQVTSIGEGAFSDCHELKDIYIYGDTAPALGGGGVFQNLNVTVHTADGAKGFDDWDSNFVDSAEGFNEEYVPPETAAPVSPEPPAENDKNGEDPVSSEAAPSDDESTADTSSEMSGTPEEETSGAQSVSAPKQESGGGTVRTVIIVAVIAVVISIAVNVVFMIIRKKNG